MSFLPGVQDAASKAYTVLDDLVAAAERGHNLITLLTELVQAVGMIFHHADVKPVEALPSGLGKPADTVWGEIPFQHSLPSLTSDQPSVAVTATTRDEKIARDKLLAE